MNHRLWVDSEGNGHRARCLCGWRGHKRVYWADAKREGDLHYHGDVVVPARYR